MPQTEGDTPTRGGDKYLSMKDIFLLIINEKMYKSGEIDRDTKEKIDMEIKCRKTCGTHCNNTVISL